MKLGFPFTFMHGKRVLFVEELILSHDSGNIASHRQFGLSLLSWGGDEPFYKLILLQDKTRKS